MRGERDLYRDKIEVSLDGKQVFYLFFGGAVIASLVFVVGVMVGKRLESRAHADQATSAELARHDPLAALDMLAAGGGDALSFPNELREARSDAPIEVADPKKPTPSAAEKKAEALKAEADAKAKADAAKAEAKALAEKKNADLEAKAKAKAKADADAKAKAKAKAKAAKKTASADKKSGKFTLQLSSFQSEAEAEAFYNQLRKSGYRPYISRAEVPGKGTWFRVRLGKYADYPAAVAAKSKFEKRQKIIAYVTRIR